MFVSLPISALIQENFAQPNRDWEKMEVGKFSGLLTQANSIACGSLNHQAGCGRREQLQKMGSVYWVFVKEI